MFVLGNFGICAVIDDLVFRKIVSRSNTVVQSELEGISERFVIHMPFSLACLWFEFCWCGRSVCGLKPFKFYVICCILLSTCLTFLNSL